MNFQAPKSRRAWKGRVVRFGITAGLVYMGVLLVLLALENWLVFHPVRAEDEWVDPAAFHLAVEDVELQIADGIRIHGWWCPLKEASQNSIGGALLYCHGNAGNLSHRAYVIPSWHRYGQVPVLIFDYPGYGKSAGKPSEAGCYAAAEAAYEWLVQNKGIPAERIWLYGDSLGGAVTVDLASRKPHGALILVRTFTSVPDVGQQTFPWLPVRWVMRNRFDNLAKIGKCPRPVFIAHGTADSLIPFRHSERLYEAANEPKSFFILENAEHNDSLPPEFFLAVRDFLKTEALPSSQPTPGLSPN
jgi:fermentation-respiration switch protein FrsA (DUF1100 family)